MSSLPDNPDRPPEPRQLRLPFDAIECPRCRNDRDLEELPETHEYLCPVCAHHWRINEEPER